MSTFEPDPRVIEFRDRLTGRSRRSLDHAAVTAHAHLVKALNRGHTPKAIADACNRDLPSADRAAYGVLQSRLAWFADNGPESQDPPAPSGLGQHSPEGCEHTDDPNGWLTDDTGRISGKCPCWTVPA